jgi:reactive intermediate/imine deaminase
MIKKIETTAAPAAIGTYSQAIRSGDLIFISGQIPLDPLTMNVVSEQIREQAHQVFNNLTAVCKAADVTLQHAVKLTIYLTDLLHFPVVNEVMTEYFEEPYPARATVEVSALPKGVQIEIDAICVAE